MEHSETKRKKLQSSRHKIKNLHTRDRRGLYVTPSERDVRCPHNDHQWVKIASTGYGNDMGAICTNPDANCDYKEEMVPGVINLCRRYWKTDDQGFQQISEGMPQPSQDRQKIRLSYDLTRLFLDKVATVRMKVSKQHLQYRYLLYSGDHFRFEPWSEYGGSVNWTVTSGNIRSHQNVGHKTGMIIKGMDDEKQYRFYFYVRPESDDDTVGAIFKYDRITKHYYSVEWNKGGMTPTGLSVKKNIFDPDTGRYTEEVIFHNPSLYWESDWGHNILDISVYEDSVTVRVYTPYVWWHVNHWHNSHQWFTYSVPLTDPRLRTGTYGLMTQSQVANFTYLAGDAYVESSISTYDKHIPLGLISKVGDNHIISESMEDVFKVERDDFLLANGMNRSELMQENYQVLSSNVFESVEFDDRTKLTSDPNRKISMRTWDYDTSIPYVKIIDVTGHTPRIITDNYPIVRDVFVRGVTVEFEEVQYEDSFTLEVGGERVFDKRIMLKRWSTQFDPYINATATFNIVFNYTVNDNPISFYWKYQDIDTHDKLFTVKDSVLTWHHVPTRE